MKRIFLFIFMICINLASIGHASQLVSSKISEVTLFSSQAMVIREGQAALKPGLNELLVETHAFFVDKDACSAQIFGTGELISVQVKTIPLSDFPQKQIQTLQEKLRETEKSRNVLSDKKVVLAKKSAFLEGLIDFSKTQIPKDVKTHFPSIENIKETLAFIGSTSTLIHTENQALDTAIEETDREIERLKKELSAVRGRKGSSKQVIEILFNAGRQETARLKVQYLVKKAFWQPFYKIDVPNDLSEVGLTMLARISQKSGENWEDIQLSVSNVPPIKGTRLPEVSPWVLDLPRPAPLASKKMRTQVMAEAPVSMTLEEAILDDQQTAPAGYASAKATRLPHAFEYEMPFPVDIESRDQATILPLLTQKLSGDFFHYSIPGKTALTLLVAEAATEEELLEGKMNVFFGGHYIGETFLTEKKPSEPFLLNLGADRNVKVRREKLADTVKETYFGAIQRDTIVRAFQYQITAENLKSEAVQLKIVDRVPVSRTDKIQIKDIEINPPPKENNYQDKKGVMLWEFQLAPKEAKEISIGFIVTYPTQSPPAGL